MMGSFFKNFGGGTIPRFRPEQTACKATATE